MKKIININFQGRVIPIEETAFEILKDYIESLRGYFANEEGRDEIINDIESRIAELFSDRLKQNENCITDNDVNVVINNMGRPKDLEEAEGTQSATNNASSASSASSATGAGSTGTGTGSQGSHQTHAGRSLFRASNDKIIGGVAAGLASYFGIDPAIMRLLFVLFLFMGFGLLLYIILWIVVPAKSLVNTVRKRLYRNPENKMIGGVSSGIAAYLNIDPWIPRIIFLSPFILGALRSIFRAGWMDFDVFPNIVFNGFGGTLFITYIVLWIVLPLANSSSEKLEMRGEKVDLESIKKTVKEDLENLRGRAEKFGGEVKERAQFFGTEMRQAGQNFAAETGPAIRRSGSGLGHAIGVLFKAFFLFVAGIIAFALVMALMALLFSGVGAFPFKNFILDGFWQNFLAWSTLILFLGIPIIALLTWLTRRIMGIRSRNNYLGYTFGSLWILGWISVFLLLSLMVRNFRSKTSVKEELSISQPASQKLVLRVSEGNVKYYGSDWFGFDGDLPFFSKNEDSIMLNTVQIKLIKSNDTLFHMTAIKFSNGNTPLVAEDLASRIKFPVTQTDSILHLPVGFTITRQDKFRNQQVMLVVEVPVGKRIMMDKNLDSYNWFTINVNRRRGWNIHWDERWDNSYYWNTNREYIMTTGGLEETNRYGGDNRDDNDRNQDDQNGDGKDNRESPARGRYRFEDSRSKDSIRPTRADTTTVSIHTTHTKLAAKSGTSSKTAEPGSPIALYPLLMLFE